MRKIISSLLFLALFGQTLSAQKPHWLWAKQAGGQYHDIGWSIALDKANNTYITGRFAVAATFDDQLITSYGIDDIFVAKYDPNQELVWVVAAGGAGLDEGRGVAVDDAGNTYVAGTFSETAVFGSTYLLSGGQTDFFIAKFDIYGNLIWVRRGGGSGYDQGNDVKVQSDGHVYVTGNFQGTAYFGNLTLTSAGNADLFIARYDPDGNLLWAKQAGGAGDDGALAIAVNQSGSSYITGFFNQTISFGTTSLISSGNTDIFLAKYDANGNLLFAKRAGGTGNDLAFDVSVDNNDNAYIAGNFEGQLSFGVSTLNSKGEQDAFIGKFDAFGTKKWAQQAGGIFSETAYAIATTSEGTSYVSGVFNGSMSIGNGILFSEGKTDFYIAKYDHLGNLLWVEKAGGTENEFAYGIVIDENDNFYITGRFEGSIGFGELEVIADGSSDIFISHYGFGGSTAVIEQVKNKIKIYPNPGSGNFYLRPTTENGIKPAYYQVFNTLGSLVHQGKIINSVSQEIFLNEAQGIYFLKVYDHKRALIGSDKLIIN